MGFSGLEQLVSQTQQPYGMPGGFLRGEKEGAALADTLSKIEQQQAEYDRYQKMTPLEVRKAELTNETSRLGNLQGQAQEKYGVQDKEAQLKAEQAKAALDSLPAEQRIKFFKQTQDQSVAILGAASKLLKSGASVPDTIAYLEQNVPTLANDKQWAGMKQQYLKYDPQKAVQEIDLMRHKMASSDAFADMGQQGKMQFEELQQSGRMALQGLQNEGGLAQARERATTKTNTSLNPTEALMQLSQQLQTETDPEKKKWLMYQINLISRAQETQSSIAGTPLGSQNRQPLAPPGMGAAPSGAPAPKGFVRGPDGVLRKETK